MARATTMPPCPHGTLLSLAGVRNWCLSSGFGRRRFHDFYQEAYLTCLSRLFQSIYVERLCDSAVLERNQAGAWCIRIGRETVLEAALDGRMPHAHIDVTGLPHLYDGQGCTTLRSVGIFLRALRNILSGSLCTGTLDALAADFRNSFANLILNLALGSRLDQDSQAIEPVYRGHSYYPFPALRIGPSVEDVVAVSHLSALAVSLPLLEAGGCRFHSIEYEDPRQCEQAWSGLQQYTGQGVVLPLHPWQIKLSPVVREMLRRGTVSLLPTTVSAMPLASQRTCRVLATQYDLKLPINATITGEHRLLYRLNSYNAPFVSALVREVHRSSGLACIDFQYDVASLCWDDADTSLHLSAIIRAPWMQAAGESVVPALNLWTSPELAKSLLRLGDRCQVIETFQHYCLAVMSGPLLLSAEWGLAFEPHLQNTCIAVRDGIPVRIILRDLDSTIMECERILPLCREHGIPLATDTWACMPALSTGQSRLIHAMFHGHLREVMYFLLKHTEVALPALEQCVSEAWRAVTVQAATSAGRSHLKQMQQLVGTVKNNLGMRLERSMTMHFQAANRSDSRRIRDDT